MTQDAYTLEFSAPASEYDRKISPEVLVISSVIYALLVTFAESIAALVLCTPLPAVLIFRRKIEHVRLICVNLIMIITMGLTWPVMSDGLIMGLITAWRVDMIYIVFAGLVVPLGAGAVYCLPLPEKLRVLLILTLRGIFILRESLQTALISVKLRAPTLRGAMKFRVFAYVLGSTLLKASAKSERMMSAVQVRGGFGGFRQSERGRFGVRDWCVLAGMCVYSAVIVLA